MPAPNLQLRFTIGTKLIGLIAVLLLGSVISLVWLSTRLYIESDTALIQQANADAAANLATQMQELLTSATEKMRILGTILLQRDRSPELKERLVAEFFSKDKDFLAVFLEKRMSRNHFTTPSRAISPEMAAMNDPSGESTLTRIFVDRSMSLELVARGEVQVSSVKVADQDAAITVAVPFLQDAADPSRFSHVLVTIIRQSRFIKIFSESNAVTSFLVDRHGRVLAHPDSALINASLAKLGIVKQMLEGKFNNGQTRYVNSLTGEPKLGAYRLVGFGGLGVVAEVAEAKAFEAARKVEYRSALVAWIVLCISFLAGYLYSGTITWPIKNLMKAARQISQGDFKISLKPRGRDELSRLSSTFNEMAKGLEERDRVKETFNKFHNKEIAEKLLSGEVKLGGERKEATVFFSDVRGFTALSESMEPEQVVEMLNEYMTRMVSIIRTHGGVVDKYVGDAIMALWGVPLTNPDDSIHAVRACLEMRIELAKLNQVRVSRGQPVLKIGMGLNRGPLIAGNIGSDEKMEYTVIGDAVNLASRIESMTKEYGTDLLISSSIFQQIQDRFMVQPAGSTRVKGKSEKIEVYKVLGYYNEQRTPVLVQTPYSSYPAEKSDKVVHDHDGHGSVDPSSETESLPPPFTPPSFTTPPSTTRPSLTPPPFTSPPLTPPPLTPPPFARPPIAPAESNESPLPHVAPPPLFKPPQLRQNPPPLFQPSSPPPFPGPMAAPPPPPFSLGMPDLVPPPDLAPTPDLAKEPSTSSPSLVVMAYPPEHFQESAHLHLKTGTGT